MTALLSSFRAVTCAGLVTLGWAAVGQAQEAAVFHACVTPLTGLLYQPREPGKCFHSTHRAISWTDGLGAFRAATPLGGDLSGTLPDPTVTGLQGRPVSAAAPAANDVLSWDGSSWTPAAVAAGGASGAAGGDLTGSYPDPTIALNAVTSEKIADGTIQAGDVAPGTFVNAQSPNGQFSLSVTDAGIVLNGPGGFVKVTTTGVEVRSLGNLALDADLSLNARSGTASEFRAGTSMTVRGANNLRLQGDGSADLIAAGNVNVGGAIVALNGAAGGCPAAKVGSVVTGTAASTGVVTGSVLTGSPTVRVAC